MSDPALAYSLAYAPIEVQIVEVSPPVASPLPAATGLTDYWTAQGITPYAPVTFVAAPVVTITTLAEYWALQNG